MEDISTQLKKIPLITRILLLGNFAGTVLGNWQILPVRYLMWDATLAFKELQVSGSALVMEDLSLI